MKRELCILGVCITLCFMLSGCNSINSKLNTSGQFSSTDISPTNSPTPTATPEPVQDLDLKVSVDEAISALSSVEPLTPLFEFEYEDYVVSTYQPEIMPFEVYLFSNNFGTLHAVRIRAHSNRFNSTIQLSIEDLIDCIANISGDSVKFEKETEDYLFYGVAPEATAEIFESFPAILNSSPELSSETIHSLEVASNQYDFQTVSDLTGDENTSDFISSLHNVVLEAMNCMKNVSVEHDDLTGKTQVDYGGITGLSQDVHFYTSIQDGFVHYWIGFYSSDWLFFDKIYIKPDNGDVQARTYSSYDVTRDILDFGISESVQISFYDKDLQVLRTADSISIRFENSENGSKLDVELSEDEIRAIDVLNDLNDCHKEISGMIYSLSEPL